MITVSDYVIDRLIEWDRHRCYGYPDDGVGGFDGALEGFVETLAKPKNALGSGVTSRA